MADYSADKVDSTVGTVTTARTGSTSSDTVPAGALVVWQNAGAGVHVVTLTNSQVVGGLGVDDRTISIAAGVSKAGRVDANWGDANGRVAVGIDGTATEVTYYVLGGV